MTSFRESPEFLRGRSGERVVAEWLQARGWYVVPSYDYSGEDGNKAPRLMGVDSSFAIPDLDISRGGKRLWAEVKTKTAATFTRITQRYEHGIDMRLYQHYWRVQDITGTHVWIFIVEEQTRMLLAEALDTLEPHKRVYDGRKMNRSGMVFWPRDAFHVRVALDSLGEQQPPREAA